MILSFDEKKFKKKKKVYLFLTIFSIVVYCSLAFLLPFKFDFEYLVLVSFVAMFFVFLGRFMFFNRCLKIGFDYSKVYEDLEKVCSVKCLKDFSEKLSTSIDNLKGNCD